MRQTASRAFYQYQSLLFCLLLLISRSGYGQTPVSTFTISPSQGCQPLNVQFTNTSVNAVSYQWNFGNGNTSTQANPSNVYTNSGNFTVTLTVTGPGGSNTSTQQVNVTPAPHADFSAMQLAGCMNSDIFQFQNSSSNYDSCVWDFGDGTKSYQNNPSHIYPIAGNFTVNLIVFNKILGCSDYKTRASYITIHPKPTALISIDTISSCDTMHVFSFRAQPTGNVSSYKWLFGDGAFSSLQNDTHIYGNAGVYSVKLIISNNFGCIDTLVLNQPIQVLSNPLPVITTGTSTGCKPAYINYSCSPVTNATWTWIFGNGDSAFIRNPICLYDSAGIFNGSLHVVYSNGCSQTISLAPVNIDEAPLPKFTMSNYVGCNPLTVTFSNKTNTGNYTWLWNFGDGTTSTLMNPVHVYDSIGYFVPSLQATSPNGCTNIASNGWYFVSVMGPDASFHPDVTSGCLPLTVNFSNSSVNSVQWYWDFGDGNHSTQQHPVHIFNTLGTFNVMLVATNAQGCTDTSFYPTPITVSSSTVNFVPPAPVYACAPHTINCADASAAGAWLWDFGDGTTSTLANPMHTYIHPGTFTVSLTTWMPNGGCSYHIGNFQTFIIDGSIPGFTYTVSPCPPYEVFFTDTSQNVATWNWHFGDGGNSTNQNPSHIYAGPGNYDILLELTSPGGCYTSLEVNGGVQITGLGAHATVITNDTIPPIDVQFHANSTNATWWIWSFGDGDSAFVADPTHIYSGTGPYVVTLSIGNDSCIYDYDYPPVSFGSGHAGSISLGGGIIPPEPTVNHCAPYTVTYNNPYPDADSIIWIFGDGTTSSLFNLDHTYRDSGNFQTTLIVMDSLGNSDTIYFSDVYHIVSPITDFSITTQNTCTGVSVNVITNSPSLSTNWNFGNGNISSAISASVIYPNSNASYVISLNAVDTNHCSSFIAKSFTINAANAISANVRRGCAEDSITFSAGNLNYASYLWNFGDGSSSADKNPQHAYQDSGLFLVTLIAYDINGCTTSYQLPYQVEIFDPEPHFTFTTPASNCSYVYVQFLNQSTNSDAWLWNYGDGFFSSAFQGYHLYTIYGYHDVTLTAYKNVCSKSITIPNLVYAANLTADFTYDFDKNCLPSTVSFTDLSQDAVKWDWDFGDGSTSTVQNPIHIYTKPSTSPVTLGVTDINGCKKIISKPGIDATMAGLYVADSSGCNPFNVTFADSSVGAISWEWIFGDGFTSSLQNPTHTYTADGAYNVELIVQSASGCFDTVKVDSLIKVGSAGADFSTDSVSGCVPLLVNFTDNSSNTNKWTWDFGDGSNSNLQNPSHVYTKPGVYNVMLVAENDFGCADTLIKSQLITVRGSEPYFTISTYNGCAPLSISFTDSSHGAIGWNWNFGDGITDTLMNPVHLYTDTGSYIVSLYTLDSTGCSTIYSLTDPIVVSPSAHAIFSTHDTIGCAPFTVNLDNTGSVGDSMLWLMGDGGIVYGNNPAYTYSIPGVYFLRLVAINGVGCADTFDLAQPVIVNAQPQAAFTTDLSEGCMPLQIQFTDSSYSLLNPQYHWDFGNGDTSDLASPQYTYLTDGIFTVTLTVTNEGGCSSVYELQNGIDVYDQIPPPPTSLYRVTVNDDHEIELNWHLCNLHDMNYYVVYKQNAATNIFDSIAQIFQNNVAIVNNLPSFKDQNVNTLSSSYSYKVQAVDVCGNRQPLPALKEHSTMNTSASAGNMQVDVQWTPYIGCEFYGYEIYRQDNLSGPFQKIALVDTAINQYKDTTAWCPMPYSYKVKALEICSETNIDSWSDSASAQPTSDVNKQYMEVVRSTVVNNNFVLTEWKEPDLYPYLVDRYNIYRSTDKMNFEFIASVPAQRHEFSDYATDVQHQEYYYKVEIQNFCNTSTLPGRINSSILLQTQSNEIKNTLMWTRYVDWDSGVEKYVIQKLNVNGVWEEVQTVKGNITEWEEE